MPEKTKEQQQQPNFRFDIYYRDEKIGYMQNGEIFSKHPVLNRMIAIFEDKGSLDVTQEGKNLVAKYSKKPEDFWANLHRSGFTIVRKG